MKLSKEIYRDKQGNLIRKFNHNGLITSEEYHDPSFIRSKKVLYKEEKQITSILETRQNNEGTSSEEDGILSLYQYSGESYQVFKYRIGTGTYKDFVNLKYLSYGKDDWHNVDEASSVYKFKLENGLPVTEVYQDLSDGTKSTVNYSYSNGLKVSETRTAEDGTVVKSDFAYENGKLKSKLTSVNSEFSDMLLYVYQNDLLSEEQKICRYKGIQYPAFQKKIFYNSKNEIEKTEYYGRYDERMLLYKKEEVIRKGNLVTKKHFETPNLEMMTGQYDLAALHAKLREDQMDWAIPLFDKKYAETAKPELGNWSIEAHDEKGNLTEIKMMHPDIAKKEVLAHLVYRNEYNEESLLEFVISYRINEEDKQEEMDIKKFYYYN
ncbi:hypothetical protein [Pedobacter cryoconitis]|uniref:YD repeat-containing protein n=1 Tax=Pedobacter cryoconitis TaxID=188932 RepID=A0A7X0J299_9SPHI|nr:hypothetical protein [Pedobacter cryoconitis]MBB6498341.1 hypothetical protein [Pedobacter cryoconitis]